MSDRWTYNGIKSDGQFHIRRENDYNGDCVAHTHTEPEAKQITHEHNAVDFAVRSGENWTLQDWQNWRKYHAIPQPPTTTKEGE